MLPGPLFLRKIGAAPDRFINAMNSAIPMLLRFHVAAFRNRWNVKRRPNRCR